MIPQQRQGTRRILWVLTLATFGLLVTPFARANEGLLDPSFGKGGLVEPFAGHGQAATDVTVDGKGRVLVGGQGAQYAIARLRANGKTDQTFSEDGILDARVRRYTRSTQYISGFALDRHSRIVVVGTIDTADAQGGYEDSFSVVQRFLPTGARDSGFASAGVSSLNVIPPGDIYESLNAVVVDPANRIIAVGEGRDPFPNSRGIEDSAARIAVVIRYLEDGRVDPGFGGGDGIAKIRLAADNSPQDVAIDEAGRIVVAGQTSDGLFGPSDFGLFRLLPNGELDGSFGDSGKLEVDLGGDGELASKVAIDQQGRILVAGASVDRTFSRAHLRRYLSDGSLDRSFAGDGGLFVTAAGAFGGVAPPALALDGEQQILFAHSAPGGPPGHLLVVRRYRPDGRLDQTFGRLGLASARLKQIDIKIEVAPIDVTVDHRGRALVASTLTEFSQEYSYLNVARFGPVCAGRVPTIRGTSGADRLRGTPGRDVIEGQAGNDTILGLGGNDFLCGEFGDDRIASGAGPDQLFGGPGKDLLRGGLGDDLLRGGPGTDQLFGGPGLNDLRQ